MTVTMIPTMINRYYYDYIGFRVEIMSVRGWVVEGGSLNSGQEFRIKWVIKLNMNK